MQTVVDRLRRAYQERGVASVKLKVPYGTQEVNVAIPDSLDVEVVHPNAVKTGDEGLTLSNALSKPIDSKIIDEFLADARDVCVLVNDGTRPTPTRRVLELMGHKLEGKKVSFLIATGCHRPATDEEYDFIFGDYYEKFKESIFNHDAKNDDELVHIGTSRQGTEMIVNRRALDAHKLIVIGSVEPHYFGGYTGGRKSFLPGVAGYKTLEQNHKYALRSEARALVLEGNPVHEDMMDALKSIEDKEIFSIQTVLAPDKKIYAATAGNIRTSFTAAIDSANEVFSVNIARKADLVVTVAPYPMDVDLYQSQKAIDNGKYALKEEGVLILVATCRSGIGHETFYKLMAGSDTPKGALDAIDKGYKLGYHKAAKMCEIAMWADMWAVSDLPDEEVRNVFMTPFSSVQAALDAAIEKKGKDATVTFLMEGSVTVPRLEA